MKNIKPLKLLSLITICVTLIYAIIFVVLSAAGVFSPRGALIATIFLLIIIVSNTVANILAYLEQKRKPVVSEDNKPEIDMPEDNNPQIDEPEDNNPQIDEPEPEVNEL